MRQYQSKALERVSGKPIIRPWMKEREIEVIVEILKRLRPERCLEWGSGYSTLYFPRFLGNSSQWISIEHDRQWATTIKGMNRNHRAEIFHVPPDHFPWTDKNGDGAYSDLIRYIEFPSDMGSFGFILVDGRGRKDCLVKACSLLNDRGVVVLHDANRMIYRNAYSLYKHQVVFQDYRNIIGGLWIGSNGTEMREVLDVGVQKELWSLYKRTGTTTMGKTLRI